MRELEIETNFKSHLSKATRVICVCWCSIPKMVSIRSAILENYSESNQTFIKYPPTNIFLVSRILEVKWVCQVVKNTHDKKKSSFHFSAQNLS